MVVTKTAVRDAWREGEWRRVLDKHYVDLAGRECFLCYKPITLPAVWWYTGEFDICMHPQCVLEWIPKLKNDVSEAIGPLDEPC